MKRGRGASRFKFVHFTQRRKERKDAKARPKELTRLCVFAFFAPLRENFYLIPCHSGSMTTAIVHHPVFREHDTGPGHPESPSRYSVVMDALRADTELWPALREVEAREAPRGDIQAAHSPQLYKQVERAVAEGIGYLDQDTVVSMRSFDAAKRASGGQSGFRR